MVAISESLKNGLREDGMKPQIERSHKIDLSTGELVPNSKYNEPDNN